MSILRFSTKILDIVGYKAYSVGTVRFYVLRRLANQMMKSEKRQKIVKEKTRYNKRGVENF